MPRAKFGSVPPPRVIVEPGDGGVISELNENDVLSGRGGKINNLPGNITFRTVVEDYKREYLDPRICKLEKAHVAALLVAQIRSANPPGRFLKEDPDHQGKYVEIGDQKAWKKAGQALREDASDVRKNIDEEINVAARVVAQIRSANPPGRFLKEDPDHQGSVPPPQVIVEPGDGGVISELNENDVLSGRGGRINNHPGNITFRTVVEDYKREYLDPRIRKLEKAHVAARLVAQIRSANPPGRFLKEDPDHQGKYVEIGDQKAWKKAGQALREDASGVRKNIDEEIKDHENVDVMNNNQYSPQHPMQYRHLFGSVMPGIPPSVPDSPGNAYGTSFKKNFAALLQWQKDNGADHALVPRGAVVDGVNVGEWIHHLRKLKHKYDNGDSTMLTSSHISDLDRVGMVWGNVSQVKWNAKYNELKQFFNDHGHSNVPQSNAALGSWVSDQRRKYKKSTLSQERISKLTELNLKW